MVQRDDRFSGVDPQLIQLTGKQLASPGHPAVALADAFGYLGVKRIETVAEAAPAGSKPSVYADLQNAKLSLASSGPTLRWAYGAQFAEVRIHSLTGELRVARLTGAFAAGHIVNRLTASSQLRGGMIGGLGSAVLEATEIDARSASYVNKNLSEYLVPAAADVRQVEVIWADQEGDPLDLIGVGEIGIIGVNAAIANAAYHATGHRFRSLPIRVDDVLVASATR